MHPQELDHSRYPVRPPRVPQQKVKRPVRSVTITLTPLIIIIIFAYLIFIIIIIPFQPKNSILNLKLKKKYNFSKL